MDGQDPGVGSHQPSTEAAPPPSSTQNPATMAQQHVDRRWPCRRYPCSSPSFQQASQAAAEAREDRGTRRRPGTGAPPESPVTDDAGGLSRRGYAEAAPASCRKCFMQMKLCAAFLDSCLRGASQPFQFFLPHLCPPSTRRSHLLSSRRDPKLPQFFS